jgi:hypothetical protein
MALREHVRALAERRVRPAATVFVYAAEQEAAALARFPRFVEECAADGRPVEMVDVGQGFRAELERRPAMVEQLERLEATASGRAIGDLATHARRYAQGELTRPPEPPALCRLLVNTGSLGTLISYSALTNGLPESDQAPVVIAFPGEDDQRSLNLLGLRGDMNYRIARI